MATRPRPDTFTADNVPKPGSEVAYNPVPRNPLPAEMTVTIKPRQVGMGLQRCERIKRDGRRCAHMLPPGHKVCRFHGGNAATIAAARKQMAALRPLAFQVLQYCMENVETDRQVALKAAGMVLDRSGMPSKTEISVTEDEKDLTGLSDDDLADQAMKVAREIAARAAGKPEPIDIEAHESDNDDETSAQGERMLSSGPDEQEVEDANH